MRRQLVAIRSLCEEHFHTKATIIAATCDGCNRPLARLLQLLLLLPSEVANATTPADVATAPAVPVTATVAGTTAAAAAAAAAIAAAVAEAAVDDGPAAVGSTVAAAATAAAAAAAEKNDAAAAVAAVAEAASPVKDT